MPQPTQEMPRQAQSYSVLVNPPLAITTATLPSWPIGFNYNQTIASVGGTGAVTYAVTAGSLPGGINLNAATGALTGVPGFTGPATFTITATDSVGVKASQSYSVTIFQGLSASPSSLPSANVGASYHQVISVTGEGLPYTTFTATLSNPVTGLPGAANVVANAAAGTFTIDGTPTSTGTVHIQINVQDASGAMQSLPYTIGVSNTAPTVAVAAAASPSPASATTNLSVLGADADSGEGSLTYTWSAIGSVPATVSFSTNGTNAAKNDTAFFSKDGNYTLQATISDPGHLTVVSTVKVAIDLTKPTASIAFGGPPAKSDSTSATFSFSGSDPVVGGVSSGVNHPGSQSRRRAASLHCDRPVPIRSPASAKGRTRLRSEPSTTSATSALRHRPAPGSSI